MREMEPSDACVGAVARGKTKRGEADEARGRGSMGGARRGQRASQLVEAVRQDAVQELLSVGELLDPSREAVDGLLEAIREGLQLAHPPAGAKPGDGEREIGGHGDAEPESRIAKSVFIGASPERRAPRA